MADTSGTSFRLSTRPERIFISIDKSTGRSTISFAPTDAGPPIVHDSDETGALAMRDATAISKTYPGSTIHGPYFHEAPPPGRKRLVRRPSNQRNG
jgi:hypothetical protein